MINMKSSLFVGVEKIKFKRGNYLHINPTIMEVMGHSQARLNFIAKNYRWKIVIYG